MRYVVFAILVFLFEISRKVIIVNPSAGFDVILMFAAQGFGTGISNLLIGAIGLLNKSNRFLGFALVTSLMIILTIYGHGGLV